MTHLQSHRYVTILNIFSCLYTHTYTIVTAATQAERYPTYFLSLLYTSRDPFFFVFVFSPPSHHCWAIKKNNHEDLTWLLLFGETEPKATTNKKRKETKNENKQCKMTIQVHKASSASQSKLPLAPLRTIRSSMPASVLCVVVGLVAFCSTLLVQAQYLPESEYPATLTTCKPDRAQYTRVPVLDPPSFMILYANGNTSNVASWNVPASYGSFVTLRGGVVLYSLPLAPNVLVDLSCSEVHQAVLYASSDTATVQNCTAPGWKFVCAYHTDDPSALVCPFNVTQSSATAIRVSPSTFDFSSIATVGASSSSSGSVVLQLMWVPTIASPYPSCYPRYLTTVFGVSEVKDASSSTIAVVLFVILAAVVVVLIFFFARYVLKKHCTKFQRSVQAQPVKHRPAFLAVGATTPPHRYGHDDDDAAEMDDDGGAYYDGGDERPYDDEEYPHYEGGEGGGVYDTVAFSPPQNGRSAAAAFSSPPPSSNMRPTRGGGGGGDGGGAVATLVDSGVEVRHTELPLPWYQRYNNNNNNNRPQPQHQNANFNPNNNRMNNNVAFSTPPPASGRGGGRGGDGAASSPPSYSYAPGSSNSKRLPPPPSSKPPPLSRPPQQQQRPASMAGGGVGGGQSEYGSPPPSATRQPQQQLQGSSPGMRQRGASPPVVNPYDA